MCICVCVYFFFIVIFLVWLQTYLPLHIHTRHRCKRINVFSIAVWIELFVSILSSKYLTKRDILLLLCVSLWNDGNSVWSTRLLCTWQTNKHSHHTRIPLKLANTESDNHSKSNLNSERFEFFTHWKFHLFAVASFYFSWHGRFTSVCSADFALESMKLVNR